MCGSVPAASGDAPVSFLTFPTDTTSDAADYMPLSVQEELIEALETDDQVTGKASPCTDLKEKKRSCASPESIRRENYAVPDTITS